MDPRVFFGGPHKHALVVELEIPDFIALGPAHIDRLVHVHAGDFQEPLVRVARDLHRVSVKEKLQPPALRRAEILHARGLQIDLNDFSACGFGETRQNRFVRHDFPLVQVLPGAQGDGFPRLGLPRDALPFRARIARAKLKRPGQLVAALKHHHRVRFRGLGGSAPHGVAGLFERRERAVRPVRIGGGKFAAPGIISRERDEKIARFLFARVIEGGILGDRGQSGGKRQKKR